MRAFAVSGALPDDGIAHLEARETASVQSLLLRRPPGDAVRHVLLCVPPGRGLAARRVLEAACPVSFGLADRSRPVACSVGFTFAGLEALCLPAGYLRVFQRLAPSFRTGAVRRSTVVGDAGRSSAANWEASFAQHRAHVVVSWHGTRATVDAASLAFNAAWLEFLGVGSQSPAVTRHGGTRLGHPQGAEGEWTHFGFRDDVTDLAIDRFSPASTAPDLRRHAPGALLLGWQDDEGLNRFSLPQAPEKVRRFFRGASFGVLRKMLQDLAAFDEEVARWQSQLAAVFPRESSGPRQIDRDFAKARLCGRWPGGQALRPGAMSPPTPPRPDDFVLRLHAEDADGRVTDNDAQGTGCPFGSHVRRMQARPDAVGQLLRRPLLRRSVPFGPAAFDGTPGDAVRRGQWGHFFCADLENQFEHLLGQWGARPLAGAVALDDALDPFAGPHDDPRAGLVVALEGRTAQRLTGFRAWTTTLGMAYAWYPAKEGLHMLFKDDFVPDELAGPWL